MSHFITYVALNEPAAASAKDITARYRSIYTEKAYSIAEVGGGDRRSGQAEDPSSVIVSLDGSLVSVMFVPRALPHDAYDDALSADQFNVWPLGRATMAAHRSHVIVAYLGNTTTHVDSLNAAAKVTLVAGTIANLLSGSAVVFAESLSIMPTERFAPLAAALVYNVVPVALWVRLQFFEGESSGGPSPVGVASHGLMPFVGREVEFAPAPLSAYEIGRRAAGICQYLILNGPVVKDGDRVGLTEKEVIRARYLTGGRRNVPIIEMRFERIDEHAPPTVFLSSASNQASSIEGVDKGRASKWRG